MKILAATLTAVQPRRVLILGVATGSYIPPLLARPELESLTLVDWSNEISRVMKTDRIFVRGKNMDALLKDPRARFITADARIAVTTFPDRSFDLIIDTLARPTWPGSSGLRSPQYFGRVNRILADGGVFVVGTLYRGWRDSAWSTTAWRKEVIAGLLSAFDHVQENPQAGLLMASRQPIPRATPERIDEIVAQQAWPTRLDAGTLKSILSDGFVSLSQSDVTGAKPFSESNLRSEYYYSMPDAIRFVFR
jgi:predicted membrane-bound spermidine synthase